MNSDNQIRTWRWTTVIGILVAVISLGLCGAGGYLAWQKSSSPPSAPTPATPSKPQNASALERAASGLMSSFLRVPVQEGVSFEGKPIPAGPTAKTQKMQTQAFQEWQFRKLMESWRKGHPGKSSGTETERFLADAWAWMLEGASVRNAGPFRERAKALPEADTRDPLLGFVLALVMYDETNLATTLERLKEAEKGMRAANCGKVLIFSNQYWQTRRWTDRADGKQIAASLTMEGMDTLAQAVQAGEFAPEEINHACRLMYDLMACLDQDELWGAVWEKLRNQPGLDPWLLDILHGQAAINRAWMARGKGYADTVSEPGWRGFELHLNQAREALLDAWKLHPEWPQAAGLMITVTMGGYGEPGVSTRDWFDRAVAARFDYQAAYDKLILDMRPRWHGSHQEMLGFARESLTTKRFDTDIPLNFLQVLRLIGNDQPMGAWRAPFHQPGVAEDLDRMFAGYLKDPSGAGATRPELLAQRAAAQAWCGKYERALELLKDVPDDVRFELRQGRKHYTWTWIDRKTFEAELHAFTGPLKEKLTAAETLQNQGRMEEAFTIYKQLMAENKADAAIHGFLRDRIASAMMESCPKATTVGRMGRPLLHSAMFDDQPEVARFLIENSADLNTVMEENWIPLQIPISLGQFELVQYLVEHGAEVNQTNPVRDTPLIMAIETSQPQIIEYLLAHGANINLGAKGRATPLYYAIMRKQTEIAFMLIAKGADVNGHPEDRTTPLGMAAKLGHLELVRTLLAKGADPNLPVGDNMNPLVRAARDGNVHIAALLLKNGADPNAGYRQFSALHYAAYYGHAEVARMLLAQGARSDVKDPGGQTPLDAAREQKKEALIKIMEEAGKKTK